MFKKLLKILGMLLLVLVAFGIAGYIYLASFDGKRSEPKGFLIEGNNRPLTFAHRGGALEAPENTFTAFDNALGKGIDVLEFDIRVSKDGEFVVFHDSKVKRTTNSDGNVLEGTVAQLKALDAGYRFKSDDGDFPFRGKGITIPTLREVFEKYPSTPMNIELKEKDTNLIKPFCDLIAEYKRLDSVIIASTNTDMLKTVRSECKGVATSASVGEGMWFLFLYYIGLSETFEADMQAMQVPTRFLGGGLVTKGLIDAAHERGMKFHVFTINKKSNADRLFKIGADGVMTDRPSVLAVN